MLLGFFSDKTSLYIEKNDISKDDIKKIAMSHLNKIYSNIKEPINIYSTKFSSNEYFLVLLIHLNLGKLFLSIVR
jgi:hypothetical protein